MRTNDTLPFPPTPLTPEQALHNFRQAFTLEEARDQLWRCLQPRLLASIRAEAPEAADRTATFCAHLEQLVAAIYQLPAPAPASTPLATALASLGETVSHNWVLLISPPE
ncbi:hypothetical protein [Pontibacter liquoris]|uniref:hypothetical protein n=1 Tax=Pontibacter liquoris TaxID=2905677 RepID=UPI001FA7CAB3|nr:hypothetical protein [Pontibacter liquoris]